MGSSATQNGCEITIATRAEWGARAPKATTPLNEPVGIVIIHHTSMTYCQNFDECLVEMKNIQNFHMDTRGWDDIGYNYLVGADGSIYEARGWGIQGAHVRSWNDVSVGISIMGDFQLQQPDKRSLDSVQSLITCGVTRGYIRPDYKLYGHRDMNPNTTCPGDRLYAAIQTWPHYDNNKPVHPKKMI